MQHNNTYSEVVILLNELEMEGARGYIILMALNTIIFPRNLTVW